MVSSSLPCAVRPCSQRRGLTLIELVVVLTILIALAGLLVPMLPSMLTRAHTSTCSTNMGECVRAVTVYQQLYAAYPNNWDALGDGTGVIDYFAGGSLMPAGVVSGGTAANGNGEVTTITLTAAEASALTGTGITQLQSMVLAGATAPAGFDPTFNYYTGALGATGSTITIATGTKVAGLDPTVPAGAARIQAMNLPLTGRYLVVGIGPRVSMVGKTIQTPPVHFGDQPVLNPEYGYQRLVAIFKISDSAVTAFTQAQLVGCAPVHDTGLGSIQDELQNWYQLTTGGS